MSTASKVHPSDEGILPMAGDGRMGKTKPTDPIDGMERPKGAKMSGPVPDLKSGKGLRSLAAMLKP